MKKKFPLTADTFNAEEIEAAIAVLKSGFYTMGERVRSYENALAKWIGVNHAIMVNSGSSANLLLVDALIRRTQKSEIKLNVGDEVLVPALSWPTTVWPLVQLGLVPVFVDSDPVTLAIDLKSAESALSPKTKGMFLIHVLGRACSMKVYQDFCRAHNIALIEDCCESLGAYDNGQHVGKFGLGGTLSHFFSHHLTTMEGGAIITDDAKLADDLRSQRAHGWTRDRSDRKQWEQENPEIDPRFLFVSTGYNVRPLEIEAAIGLVQIRRMDDFIAGRRTVVNRVYEAAKSVSWLEIIGEDAITNKDLPRHERNHSWMNIPFRLKKDAPISTTGIKNIFEDNAIETRAIIAGNLVRHPAIKGIKHRTAKSLTVADTALDRGFMIGCHPSLEEEGFDAFNAAIKRIKSL